MKRGMTFFVVVCVSLLATYSTYLGRRYPVPSPLQWLVSLLDYIQLPSFAASALLSGNIHNPFNRTRRRRALSVGLGRLRHAAVGGGARPVNAVR